MNLITVLGMFAVPLSLVTATGIVIVAALWCKEYCCQ